MITLGYHSAILPDASLGEVLKTAKDIGYETVEAMAWPPGKAERRYAGVCHIDVTGGNTALDDARRTIDASGVGVCGIGYYGNPLDPDRSVADPTIEHLGRVIDAAAELSIPVVGTFVGRDWTRTVDDNWPRFSEVWRPIIDHAASRGVKVAIENCPMFFTDDEWPGGKNLATTPAIWRRMFDEIPDPHFGLAFDPSHFVLLDIDPGPALREFADRIHHTHAKDVRIDRHRLNDVGRFANPNDYHSPRLPGLGGVDWPALITTLHDIGYDGAMVVEVEDRAYEGSDNNRRTALRQSHTFLRRFVG